MSKDVVVHTPPVQALTTPADDWSGERLALIKRTICRDATNDEFSLFVEVAKRSGLNPFARQIHAVKRDGKMTIQTGIDGYRLIADRTGKYAGSDDTIFDDENQPNKATVTVYKMVEGQRAPFTATARWSEYFPGDRQGFMWKKMPCTMLGKCAEALALRKAFPAELSGLYTNEEMDQADRGGVYPEQPGPDDGDREPRGWTFSFGQWRDRTVEQVYNDPKNGPDKLKSYIDYLESSAAKKGEALSPRAQEAIDHIASFLGAMENSPIDEKPEETEDDLPF